MCIFNGSFYRSRASSCICCFLPYGGRQKEAQLAWPIFFYLFIFLSPSTLKRLSPGDRSDTGGHKPAAGIFFFRMKKDNDFAGVNFSISHLVSSDGVLMRPSPKTPPSSPLPYRGVFASFISAPPPPNPPLPPTVVVSKVFCESAAGQHLFIGNERLERQHLALPLMLFYWSALMGTQH